MSKSYYNYNKKQNSQEPRAMINDTNDNLFEETIPADEFPIEEVEELKEVEEPKVEFGIVTNCDRLNIREKPSINSESIGVLDHDTEIMIDESNSTDEFYSICTKSGIEGFCMKQFISVRQ